MDENNNSSAIRLLVDALSTTLKNLSDKISSFQPILSQINNNTDSGYKEIDRILHDLEKLETTFNSLCEDFYDRTDLIIKNVETFNNKFEHMVDSIDNLTDNLTELFAEKTNVINETFQEKTIELGNMLTDKTQKLSNTLNTLTSNSQNATAGLVSKMNDVLKSVKPIGRVITFITKPIGFLIFVIGLVIASITITNCVSNITEYLSKTHNNISHESSK